MIANVSLSSFEVLKMHVGLFSEENSINNTGWKSNTRLLLKVDAGTDVLQFFLWVENNDKHSRSIDEWWIKFFFFKLSEEMTKASLTVKPTTPYISCNQAKDSLKALFQVDYEVISKNKLK